MSSARTDLDSAGYGGVPGEFTGTHRLGPHRCRHEQATLTRSSARPRRENQIVRAQPSTGHDRTGRGCHARCLRDRLLERRQRCRRGAAADSTVADGSTPAEAGATTDTATAGDATDSGPQFSTKVVRRWALPAWAVPVAGRHGHGDRRVDHHGREPRARWNDHHTHGRDQRRHHREHDARREHRRPRRRRHHRGVR